LLATVANTARMHRPAICPFYAAQLASWNEPCF
jgi:hypothetical protein